MRPIPFNKPCLVGNELDYIKHATTLGKLSGNGAYTKSCSSFFEKKYGFSKCLLTQSCTDALEMAAMLIDINPGDEIVMPSFTFVSTANAFVLRGATVVFVDSREDHPGMDEEQIDRLISPKTKAIVVVHYAGVACDMDKIMDIARRHNLFVIEDAAHAIDSYYNERPLGGIGHLSTFSFHETKNIISGEGGMLVINDESMIRRAEIIWEKGTNRVDFWRGLIAKYEWVDIGSSFLPSEITAAFLLGQLDQLEVIQRKRVEIWGKYYSGLASLERQGFIRLPTVPSWATNNGHVFYIVCKDGVREELAAYLKTKGITAVFHYLCLHKSKFVQGWAKTYSLPMSESYELNVLRLPIFFDLKEEEISYIIECIRTYFSRLGITTAWEED